jgi:ADP-ribose pyrophosphatase YjhB (NUDIX family)
MANFCPECGQATIKIQDGLKELDACPDGHFIEVPQTAVGVGALIVHDEKVLLIERARPAGLWALPSGWINFGESLSQALEREVLEETALEVEALGILSVAIRSTAIRNEMYIRFLCELKAGSPRADKQEVLQAAFVHPCDFDTLNLSLLDKRFIQAYLQQRPKPMQVANMLAEMPGISMFSLLKEE